MEIWLMFYLIRQKNMFSFLVEKILTNDEANNYLVAAIILKFYWLMISYWPSETQLRKWIWQVSSFIPLSMYSLWDYLVFTRRVILSLFNSCLHSLTSVSWTSVENVRLIINDIFRLLRPVYFGKFCEPGMGFFEPNPCYERHFRTHCKDKSQ